MNKNHIKALTLRDALENPEWGESNSRAFYLNESKEFMFFMMSDKPFIFNSPGELKAKMDAIKICPTSGDCWPMTLYIKHKDTTEDISFSEFKGFMEQTIAKYREKRNTLNPNKIDKMDRTYNQLGYSI
jgi:hypothetical protein